MTEDVPFISVLSQDVEISSYYSHSLKTHLTIIFQRDMILLAIFLFEFHSQSKGIMGGDIL